MGASLCGAQCLYMRHFCVLPIILVTDSVRRVRADWILRIRPMGEHKARYDEVQDHGLTNHVYVTSVLSLKFALHL